MNDNDSLDDSVVSDLIQKFQGTHARGMAIDFHDFLPPRYHRLYARMRRELLAADLELAWQEGKRRLLLDYLGAFPDLLDDRAAIETLAFAEYRNRRFAGEEPALAEYEWHYGITTADWPERLARLPAGGNDAVNRGDPKTEVAPAPESVATRVASPHIDAPFDGAEGEPEVEATSSLNQAMHAFPAVGTQFLNFHLVAELGRGGFGRVYLARQGDLAHRLVALKITVDTPGEEQKLAKLQHTNVVPVYSFHRAGDLHAVCMPFFGSTTLADIVRTLRVPSRLPDSGRSLVNTVRLRRGFFLEKTEATPAADPSARLPAPSGMPPQRPVAGLDDDEESPVTLTMLESASYAEAVLWIVERLTEGLSHAHAQGILHGDLKPANVLLTDDGQPMLLDFNLSRDTRLDANLHKRRVGGTLPYMAPEHLAALSGAPATYDERSDVYALGVILFEMLTGRQPFATPKGPLSAAIPDMIAQRMQPPPFLRTWNPAIPFAVESIVRHCLEGDPRRRYQSARQLREDLKRQRQHRPLRYAAEPSLRERLKKWARRHPRLLSPTALGTVAALVLAASIAPMAWSTWKTWQETNQERDLALQKAQADLDDARTRELRQAEAIEKYRVFRASRGNARAVMESVNAVRLLPRFMKAWTVEESRLEANVAKCRAALAHYDVLERPDWQAQPSVVNLPKAERLQLRRDIAELLFVLAEVDHARAVQRREQSAPWDYVLAAFGVPAAGFDVWASWQSVVHVPVLTAWDLSERARQAWPEDAIPRALWIQQAELLTLQGQDERARALTAKAENTPLCPGTEDGYWTASALAARGDFKQALPLVAQTVADTPDHYGAWLLRGLCLTPRFSIESLNVDQVDRQKALECFTTCIVMRPEGLWAYYHRGLVSYNLKLNKNAIADFDRVLDPSVLDRQPAFAAAYVPRSGALFDLGNYQEAEAGLTRAIAIEPNVPDYYYLRARVRKKLNKHAEARSDEQEVLAATPATVDGWIYRGMVRAAKEPELALGDFDRALAIEPDEPLALFSKGNLLAQNLQRPLESIAVFTKALTRKPDYVEARIARGLAYAAIGHRKDAHKDADAALDAEPTPQMHYQAARVYALTSRRQPMDAQHALRLLAYALRHGHGVQTYRDEPDLAPLKERREFDLLSLGLKFLGVP